MPIAKLPFYNETLCIQNVYRLSPRAASWPCRKYRFFHQILQHVLIQGVGQLNLPSVQRQQHLQQVNWRLPKLGIIQDGWETFIQDRDFGGFYMMDFWRLQQSGLFYYRTLLRPSAIQSGNSAAPAADVKFVAVYIAQAIDCLTRLYDGLFEDSEYISINLRILNTDGRRLVNSGPDSMPLWADYVCRIPEILVERQFPIAEWRAAVIEHAVAITNEVYLRFNWTRPNLNAARGAMERTFARRW